MRFNTAHSEESGYERYFTMKYVAGYRAGGALRYPAASLTSWPVEREEVEARSGIDAPLSAPLPERELWRERQAIEAKLFGAGHQYTPFL